MPIDPIKPSKPKRIPFSISLSPEVGARLTREADARLLNPSVLVEKGLSMLFTSFDVPPMPEDKPEPPKS